MVKKRNRAPEVFVEAAQTDEDGSGSDIVSSSFTASVLC